MLPLTQTGPGSKPDPPLPAQALQLYTCCAFLQIITVNYSSLSRIARHLMSVFAGGSSVAQHLLLSYQTSFLEIMRAQFSEMKAFSGGSQVRRPI